MNAVNGPVACLFRVTLGFRNEGDERPVMPAGACRSVTVIAKDGETAVKRAREGLREEGCHDVERALLVSLDLVEGVDLP